MFKQIIELDFVHFLKFFRLKKKLGIMKVLLNWDLILKFYRA